MYLTWQWDNHFHFRMTRGGFDVAMANPWHGITQQIGLIILRLIIAAGWMDRKVQSYSSHWSALSLTHCPPAWIVATFNNWSLLLHATALVTSGYKCHGVKWSCAYFPHSVILVSAWTMTSSNDSSQDIDNTLLMQQIYCMISEHDCILKSGNHLSKSQSIFNHFVCLYWHFLW